MMPASSVERTVISGHVVMSSQFEPESVTMTRNWQVDVEFDETSAQTILGSLGCSSWQKFFNKSSVKI